MDWKEFEDAVADIFKLFGYSVVKNTKINAAQTDIFAKSNSRFKPDLLVECKYHQSSEKRVSIDEVENFKARVISLRMTGKIDQGYLVTNTGFTSSARECLSDTTYVHLINYNELFYQFIDTEYYLKEFVDTYEKKYARQYVQLNCTDIKFLERFNFEHSIESYRLYLDLDNFNFFKINIYFKDTSFQSVIKNIRDVEKFESFNQIVSNSDYKLFHINEIISLSNDGLDYIYIETKTKLQREIAINAFEFERELKRTFSNQRYEEIVFLKKEKITSTDREITGRQMSIENPSVESYVSNFLTNNNRLLMILGDFGSGKSTTLANIMYTLAKKKLISSDNPKVPIPIFLSLKNYAKYIDFDTMIANFFHTELGYTNINIKTFKKMNEMGAFTILLDGFDEMSRLITPTERRITFKEICNFVNDNNKVILSCRPGYFNDNAEISKLILSYLPAEETVEYCGIKISSICQIACLQLLDQKKIDTFIQNNTTLYYEEIVRLTNSRSLSDLSTRPVLLRIIIDTYKELRNHVGEDIDLRTLYEIYTQKWINREEDKGTFRLLIDSKKKSTFLNLIAVQMHEEQRLSIHYSELDTLIKQYFNLENQDGLDHFSHDIRTCSFLSRDDNGNYYFMHKSFLEYFIAREFSSFETPTYNTSFFVQFNSEIRNFIDMRNTPLKNFQLMINRTREIKKYLDSIKDFEKLQQLIIVENEYMIHLQKHWPDLYSIKDSYIPYMKRVTSIFDN